MKALLAVLILVLAGLLGARFGFREERGPLGLRLLLATGTHFLVLGYLLGPQALGLFTPELLDTLSPVIMLGLGWIGLLFGLQFEVPALRGFRADEHVATFGQAVVAFAVLAGAGLAALELLGVTDPLAVPLTLAGAATGAISTPTGLGVVFGSIRASGPVSRLLSLAASLDAAVGLVALAGVLAWFHPPSILADAPLAPLRWMAVSVLMGLLFGWLFLSLTRDPGDPQEFVLFLLGLALLAAGVQAYFSVSALFGCAVAGAFIANATPMRERAFQVLSTWETPVHVLFLLLSGALLRFTGWVLVPMVLGYVVLRVGGKLLGGAWLARTLPPTERRGDLGLGLTAQGGISVAMAVSVHHVLGNAYPGSVGPDLFFATVVLGVAACEMIGPPLIRRLLVRAGEADGGGEAVARRVQRAAYEAGAAVDVEGADGEE